MHVFTAYHLPPFRLGVSIEHLSDFLVRSGSDAGNISVEDKDEWDDRNDIRENKVDW